MGKTGKEGKEEQAFGLKAGKKGKNPAAGFFIRVALVCAIFLVLHIFIFGMRRVSGSCMYPSVRDGDLCIFYQLETYHVGDVVLYDGPDGRERLGRISVMSGEFDIKNNRPYLNGAQMSEENAYETPAGKYGLPCSVTDGQYFILNDFRSNTDDSRNFGPVERKNIHGKAMFLFRRRGF